MQSGLPSPKKAVLEVAGGNLPGEATGRARFLSVGVKTGRDVLESPRSQGVVRVCPCARESAQPGRCGCASKKASQISYPSLASVLAFAACEALKSNKFQLC